MNLNKLKEFLRPDARKIYASIALTFVYVLVFITTWKIVSFRGSIHPVLDILLTILAPAVGLYTVIAEYPLVLLFTVSQPLAVAIVLYVTYLFGCYICVNKKLIEGVLLYFAALFIIGGTLIFSAYGYNQLFAFSCEKDSDCIIVCDDIWGDFSVNNKYIALLQDSCSLGPPVCVNYRCASAGK